MKKLFIIDGAAGTGKSDLLEHVERQHGDSTKVVKKYTTRKQRAEEKDKKLDLLFIDTADFKTLIEEKKIYYYSYGGASYGISKEELDNAVLNFEYTFVIIRNVSVAKRIMDRYSRQVQVIHVFIYTDRSRVQERLQKEEVPTSVLNFRLSRTEKTWKDYIENYTPKSKHVILINDSNIEHYHRLINELISEYSEENEDKDKLYINSHEIFPLLPSLIGFKEVMKKMINMYLYERNVFLMMKYRPNNAEIYDFIKDELQKNGYNCVRADEPEWEITQDVFNPIAVLYCCKYGIALFDEPEEKQLFSPNVAYELGIMQAQNKNCLILKHESLKDEPFFDLMKDLHKVYKKEIELRKFFKNWISNIERLWPNK